MGWYYKFAPYVSVAERKHKAAKEVQKLKKKGQLCQPVVIEGKSIANTFWGKAWCKHLESYSDYANRLPRGRSYVRQGAVLDLKIQQGNIEALVSGSSIYKVKITISKVAADKWNKMVNQCAGKIDSLIELLQGKFSQAVMQMIINPEQGLFPQENEIKLSCSCLDWADMCKHVAAVLYGVGARFDERPEELFVLRQADHLELIAKAGTASLAPASVKQAAQLLDADDLSSIFGIDISEPSLKQVNPSKQPVAVNKKKASAKSTKVKTTARAPLKKMNAKRARKKDQKKKNTKAKH